MRKIVGFVILLFLLFSLGESLNLFAQDPDDPGNPDTVYYVGAGLHSGYDLYVPPGPGPHDVYIEMYIWTDNDVQGILWPQVDLSYGPPSNAFLDPLKNTDSLVSWETLTQSSDIKGLNLAGTGSTPTPPHFSFGAINFAAKIFGSPGGLVGHLVFTVSDTGHICLDTMIMHLQDQPLALTTPEPKNYVPIFKPACFHVMVNPSSCPTENEEGPSAFALLGNYPNPFNPTTSIPFHISCKSSMRTTLTVYNILGQRVRALVNEDKLPGEYKVVWDGKDENGEPVSSGIYLYKLDAGNFSATKRMILIK
jgi:hypothetical protein